MKARFPHPGEVFEDKYTVEAVLGSGGFARVYRAVESGLDRKVALKILRPRIEGEQSDSQRDSYLETVMQRFRREAKLLSQLRSPNTITMHHYGKTEGGLLYMVLEYIDGLSLAELMRAGKPLPPKRVATILEQVLNSLQEAHTLGMLHRDLKPANIMIFEHMGNRDNVKLLDFGIAKLVKDVNVDRDLTGDGTLVGTPRYMAPEQIRGESEVGPSADIYALGLVAFELLVGERAIEVDSSIKIIGRQLSPDSFFLPIDINCPPRLRHIIDKMLQKDAQLRFQSAEQVIAALRDPDLLSEDFASLEVDLAPLDAVDEILAGGPLDEDGFEELELDDLSIMELDPEADSVEIAKANYLANPDTSVEEPFDPSKHLRDTSEESITTSFSGLAGDRRRPVILAGVVFLAIVVSLLAIVFLADDDNELAHAETKNGENSVGSSDTTGTEIASVGDDDDRDAGRPELENPERPIEAPEAMPTVIASNLDETEILIDGEPAGVAPVEVAADRFPVRVEAVHKGRSQTFEIPASTGGQFEFKFDEVKEAPKPKPASTSRVKKKKKKYDIIPY